jgi:hypothetical protein
MKKRILVLLMILIALTANCFAQDNYFVKQELDKRTTVGVGAWMIMPNGTAKGTWNGIYNSMDFRSTLGMQNFTALVPMLSFKINNDSSLYFDYFSVDQSFSNSLGVGNGNFWWKGVFFPIGNVAQTRLRCTFADAIYRKNWFKSEDGEINLGVGIKYGGFALNILNVTQNAGTHTAYTAVIPVIDVSGKKKLSNNFSGIASINLMGGASGPIQGNIMDLNAGFNWAFSPNWGMDLSYRWFAINGSSNASLGAPNISANMSGPQAIVKASF